MENQQHFYSFKHIEKGIFYVLGKKNKQSLFSKIELKKDLH